MLRPSFDSTSRQLPSQISAASSRRLVDSKNSAASASALRESGKRSRTAATAGAAESGAPQSIAAAAACSATAQASGSGSAERCLRISREPARATVRDSRARRSRTWVLLVR